MSVRWKKLYGETSLFAVEIAFIRDPDRGSVESREVSESWGSFSLWVNGQNLCAHDEDEIRVDAVHWNLLPLIEWFVEHWDPIFHEERPPHRQTRGADGWACLMENADAPPALVEDEDLDWLSGWQAWWNRHCIQAARRGGLFPSVVFRRWRHQVEVSWGTGGLVGAPSHFRFTNSRGSARFEPSEVAGPLFHVLGEAIGQLADWLPGSQRIDDLSRSHRSLGDGRADRRLGWLAGIGVDRWRTFSESVRAGSNGASPAIRDLLNYEEPDGLVLAGSCRAALMFGSLSPSLVDADMAALAIQLIHSFRATPSQGAPLDRIATPTPIEQAEPWRQAYRLAEEVLRKLDLWKNLGESIDIETALATLDIRVDDIDLDDADTRGLAFVSAVHQATILVNTRHPANCYATGRRFTLSHELCHLLFDRSSRRELALGSGPWAPQDIESRANAFAAMFLMPTVRIRSLIVDLGEPLERRDQVQMISSVLQTGFTATLEHLANLGFLSWTHKQAIESE